MEASKQTGQKLKPNPMEAYTLLLQLKIAVLNIKPKLDKPTAEIINRNIISIEKQLQKHLLPF